MGPGEATLGRCARPTRIAAKTFLVKTGCVFEAGYARWGVVNGWQGRGDRLACRDGESRCASGSVQRAGVALLGGEFWGNTDAPG